MEYFLQCGIATLTWVNNLHTFSAIAKYHTMDASASNQNKNIADSNIKFIYNEHTSLDLLDFFKVNSVP